MFYCMSLLLLLCAVYEPVNCKEYKVLITKVRKEDTGLKKSNLIQGVLSCLNILFTDRKIERDLVR